jgi:hypothetical protein
MINKKALFGSAAGVLVLIFALNVALRMATLGQMEPTTFGAKATLTVITILAAPVIVYNHFTHANEGPITLMQIVLLITSSIFWGIVIERMTHFVERRKAGGIQ